jgi:polysaccharide pyruvyl transferase WcaK-like protein
LLIPFARQNWVAELLLNKQEVESYKLIKTSDLIISKGGSFFCDNHGKLGFLSFFRLWYIALLAVKLNKKVIILGQSIGPLNSGISKWYGNYLLKKFDKVILRESVCLSEYQYFVNRDYLINNDMVFYQKIVEPKLNSSSDSDLRRKVGVTIKYVDKDQDKYFSFVKSAVEIMVKHYNFDIVILPQVPLDSDINASKEIWNTLNKDVQKNVVVLDDLDGIENLLKKYSELYFVLGTRLHSCIFSWSVGVPAINISYHGTKSQGIYDNLGLSNWVLDYSSEKSLDLLRKNISLIIESRESIVNDVANRITKDRVEIDKIINDLLSA